MIIITPLDNIQDRFLYPFRQPHLDAFATLMDSVLGHWSASNGETTATFDGGTLQVLLLPAFNPAAGQSFDIMDCGSRIGTFSSLSLPRLPTSERWNTLQLYTSGVLSVVSTTLPGAFNHDGVVNAADYIVTAKQFS